MGNRKKNKTSIDHTSEYTQLAPEKKTISLESIDSSKVTDPKFRPAPTPLPEALANAPVQERPTNIGVPAFDSSKVTEGAVNKGATSIPTFAEYQANKKAREEKEAAEKKAADEAYAQTWQGMLDANKKTLQQEKTDAEKMQRYYALTDALKAIGKIGGSAVGGAIGGNMLDSAPAVGEYKESRGYINAFEKAKQANDRLKALENEEYKLAYSRQISEADRAYKAEQDNINREWTAEQNRIKMEWEAALAEKNFEKKAALEKELAQINNKFKLALAGLETKQKEMYYNYVSGAGKKNREHYIELSDGRNFSIAANDLQDMQNNFIGKRINTEGDKTVKITKDNFDFLMRNYPKHFEDYLVRKGFITKPDKNYSWPPVSRNPSISVEGSSVNPTSTKDTNIVIEDDLAQFEQK